MALIYVNGTKSTEIPRVPGLVKYNGTDIQKLYYGETLVWDVSNVLTPDKLNWGKPSQAKSWHYTTVCTVPVYCTIHVYSTIGWYYQDGNNYNAWWNGGSRSESHPGPDGTAIGGPNYTVSFTVPAYTEPNAGISGPSYFYIGIDWHT